MSFNLYHICDIQIFFCVCVGGVTLTIQKASKTDKKVY